jgi:hypothetical protein
VESSSQVQRPIATFENQCLTVRLPSIQARHWADSEEVGIEAEQPIGDGTSLRLVVEKDFECLHPRGEEIADAFPRPAKADPAHHWERSFVHFFECDYSVCLLRRLTWLRFIRWEPLSNPVVCKILAEVQRLDIREAHFS